MSKNTRTTPLATYLQEIARPFFSLADLMDFDESDSVAYPTCHIVQALAEWARWKLKSAADAIEREVGAVEVELFTCMDYENQANGVAGHVCGATLKSRQEGAVRTRSGT